MHRGRDIIIGFALSNKSPFFTRGAPLVEDHQLLCDSMFFRDPFVAIQLLSSPSLDFLRPGLICRTPKVPFSFPLLPFVRVSFNLLLFLSPLSPLVVHHPHPFSLLSYVSSVISTSASRGNSLSACRVPSHPLAPLLQRRFVSSITFLPRLATLCSPSIQSSTGASLPWNVPDPRYEFRSQSFDNLIIHYKRDKRAFVPFYGVVETISRKGILLNWDGNKYIDE